MISLRLQEGVFQDDSPRTTTAVAHHRTIHREKLRWKIMGQAYSASTRSRILKGMLINVPKKQQYKKILQGLEILWVKTTDFKAQHSPPDPLTS